MKSSIFIWAVLVLSSVYIACAGLSYLEPPTAVLTAAIFFSLSCYVGGDQVAAVIATKKMPPGERFRGNRKKLVKIIIAIFVLAAECFLFDLLTEITMPTAEMLAALFANIGLLVGGEKAKTATEGKKEV